MTVGAQVMVKNGDDFIKAALDAVAPYVQGLAICDTGSTDKTCEIIRNFVKGYRVGAAFFWQEATSENNKGFDLLAVRNKLVDMTAWADWSMVLDHDEIWDLDMIAAQIAVLSKLPSTIYYVACRCFHHIKFEQGKNVETILDKYWIKFYRNGYGINFAKPFPNELLMPPVHIEKRRAVAVRTTNKSIYFSPFLFHHFSLSKKETWRIVPEKITSASFEYTGLLPEVLRG